MTGETVTDQVTMKAVLGALQPLRHVAWILGAGFSKSLGAPLLAQLLTERVTHSTLADYERCFPDPELARVVAHVYERGSSMTKPLPLEAHWEHAEEFLERLDLATDPQRKSVRHALRLFLKRIALSHGQGFVPRPSFNRQTLKRLEQVALAREQATADAAEEADLVQFRALHECALRMMAAECSAFLKETDLDYEKWGPYRRWADKLCAKDTIITFNYDRVLERLRDERAEALMNSKEQRPMLVQRPWLLAERGYAAPIYKLHGSVDWMTNGEKAMHVSDGGNGLPEVKPENHEIAALFMPVKNMALATPGPRKRTMVGGCLASLWADAANALRDADAIVFIGYKIPPSDAQSRDWLIQALLQNPNRKRLAEMSDDDPHLEHESGLVVHTVLGPDVNGHDSRRLHGMISNLGGCTIRQHPMWAEDFLAVFDRRRL